MVLWVEAVLGGLLLVFGVPIFLSSLIDLLRPKSTGGGWGMASDAFAVPNLIVSGFYILNGYIFMSLVYAFSKRRAWGRYVALGHNSLVIVGLIGTLVFLWRDFGKTPEGTLGFIFIAIVVLSLGMITKFCLSAEAKRFMCN